MLQLFHSIIYQPLYNLLIFFYNTIPGTDLGVAIIFVTIFIRLLLYPLAKKQIESQKALQVIQPEVKKLQEKHKGNKEEQSRAVLALYKEKKVNPAGGCLPLVVQLIVFIALYQALIAGINFSSGCKDLYGFIACPEAINTISLGFLNLATPSLVLAFFAAVTQYYQAKMMMPKEDANEKKSNDMASAMNKQMLYLFPLLTLFIGAKFPSGLAVYWIVNTVFTIAQQYQTKRKLEKANS